MNLIDAYINAIKANLPTAKREDVAAELQVLIEESLEADTGKSPTELSEAELQAWLKTREHPSLVAARYHERRCLIDEDCFPYFKLTLRYTLFGIAIAFTVLTVLAELASDRGDYLLSLWNLMGSIVHFGLLAFAALAIAFHFGGQHFNARERLASWNPKDLPHPGLKWQQEPYSSSIAGLVFTALALLFLNGYLNHAVTVTDTTAGRHIFTLNVDVVAGAVALLPWINGVLIASFLLCAFMLIRPRWTPTTLGISVLIALATVAVIYPLQALTPLFTLVPESVSHPESYARMERWANANARIVLIIILLVNLYEAGRDSLRMVTLLRRNRSVT